MGVLEGRVVYITGAARGQGRSHAVRFAKEGADIVGLDICEDIDVVPYALGTEEDLAETKRLVEATGRRMLTYRGDVRSLDDQRKAFDAGVAEFGHIDTVLANAGTVMSNTKERDAAEAWRVGIDIMLTGVWNTFHTAVPYLIERNQGGNIVATSSMAGILCLGNGNGGDDAYTAAKIGVTGLVKAYANYLAQYNIRVNGVAPANVNTPMVTANPELMNVIAENPNLVNAMQLALPNVFLTEPEDITETILFLISQAGRYYTGSILSPDAGMSIRR